MIDRERGKQAFIGAFVNTPRARRDLVGRCRSACRGMTPAPIHGEDAKNYLLVDRWCRAFARWSKHRSATVADAWLRKQLTWLRDDKPPDWLRRWAEGVVHQFLWRYRMPFRFHHFRFHVTVDTEAAMKEQERDACPGWRTYAPEEQPPMPRRESKKRFLARMEQAYDSRRDALATAGLLERKSSIERHAEWYVQAGVLGASSSEILSDWDERNANRVDLSTVKKGIVDFARLTDLPLPPKSPIAPSA
jgi:hypothetical protein